MKRWKGLLQKEWAQMKWRLVFFVLINNLILFWGVDHLVYGCAGRVSHFHPTDDWTLFYPSLHYGGIIAFR